MTREDIIAGMCYTCRHDFGLDKRDSDDFASQLSSGMTRSEREALWQQMAQIFDNNIAPHMEFKSTATSRDICGND